jgi:hypothetical protein
MRSGNKGFPYRTAFLRMDCGTADLVPLTVGIEMAGEETGVGPGPLVITVNGARVENGWTPEFLVREPVRFGLRTTSLMVDMMAGVDDGGSIEIFTPNPNIDARSTARLTMDGFSGAYAMLRRACEAVRGANAGAVAQEAPPAPALPRPVSATRFVPSSEGRTIGTVTALNPDCSSRGPIVARVVEKPAHGDVGFENGDVFPNYVQTSPLFACNSKRTPGLMISYRSKQDFIGQDNMKVFLIFPDGSVTRWDFTLIVK